MMDEPITPAPTPDHRLQSLAFRALGVIYALVLAHAVFLPNPHVPEPVRDPASVNILDETPDVYPFPD